MGIGTILIGLALLTVIVILVVIPLLEPYRPAVEPPNHRQSLEAEREATVRAIRELDLDYRTRKLNEEDYKSLRDVQVQRGAAVLRELDQLTTQDEIGAQIEERIAVIRNSGPICPSCGSPIHTGDRFCVNCGHRFEKAEKTINEQSNR
jgi:hypothetical protein